jgi:hypothetical protein
MRTSKLCYLTAVVALLYASVARAQMTKPFEALEASRRDRIEQEKRAAHDAVEQRRIEKKRNSEQAAETRAAAAKRAEGAPPSANPAAPKTRDTTAREIKR